MFLFTVFFSAFFGVYAAYFFYLRVQAKKSWDMKIDEGFQPAVSILIPVHNEERTIESKLENIKNVSYPKEKMELIVADDASEDGTLVRVREYMKQNSDLSISVVQENPRVGKSATLNRALAVSKNEIVIVSDADTRARENRSVYLKIQQEST